MADIGGNTTTEDLISTSSRDAATQFNIPDQQATNASTSNKELLDFPLNDPANPRNWSKFQKWKIIIPITLIDLSVSWGASGYSPAEKNFIADFGVSEEIGTLGLSLYILGLAFGPMSLAPLSEVC